MARKITFLLMLGIFGCAQDKTMNTNPVEDRALALGCGGGVYRTPDAPIDIIWVIDDSSSMAGDQALIQASADEFISELIDTNGLDYRIGITTTSVYYDAASVAAGKDINGRFISQDGNPTVLTSKQNPSEVESDFAANVLVGTFASPNFEQGYEGARLAISNEVGHSENRNFVRDSARLAIVIIADEDDQSHRSTAFGSDVTPSSANYYVNGYINHFAGLKATAGEVMLAQVTPGAAPTHYANGMEKAGDIGMATAAIEVAGVDWASALEELGQRIVEFAGADCSDPDDPDGDGLSNDTEADAGTDPDDADTDNDGRLDGDEDTNGNGTVDEGETDPNNPDTDGDGIPDGTEVGMDQPGGRDTAWDDFVADRDPTTTTDPLDTDSDDDGLDDGAEDTNHDGARNDTETDAANPDTDGGTVPDGVEVNEGRDPLDPEDDFFVAGSGGCAIGGADIAPRGFPIGLAVLALALRRRGKRLSLGLVAVIGLAFGVPTSARAQDLDLRQFQPAPSTNDVLALESARVGSDSGYFLFVSANYAHRPLRYLSRYDNSVDYPILKNRTSVDLGGSFTFGPRFELGAVLPFVANQDYGSDFGPLAGQVGSVRSSGIGDLTLSPKYRLVEFTRVSLAAAAPTTLPTGASGGFLSSEGVTARPQLVADYLMQSRPFRIIGNLGFAVRSESEFRNVTQGTALDYGLGTEVPLTPDGRWLGLATLVGEIGLSENNTEERPMELLGGARWKPRSNLWVTGAAGPGITRGAGTPDYRAFVQVSFSGVHRRDVVAQLEPAPEPVPEPQPAPEPPPAAVVVNKESGTIDLREQVYFETDKDVILSESYPLLAEVAAVMNAHPEIRRVSVNGHTDSVGSNAHNQSLSARRAQSVVKYLTDAKVDPSRLTSKGFGESEPIADNESVDGRAKNRRVEIRIVEMEKSTPAAK